MAREIRFRGKRIDNGEWAYGSLVNNLWTYSELTETPGVPHCDIVTSGECNDYEEAESDGVIVEVDPKTVGQFTGLLDKNGKEIYEGDVVKYLYGRQGDLEGTPLEVVKPVIFHNGSFEAGRPLSEWVQSPERRLQYRNSSYYNTHMRTTDYFTEHDFEVIGNRFEHPELLESEKEKAK